MHHADGLCFGIPRSRWGENGISIFLFPYIATHTAEEAYHAAQAHDLAWGAIRRPEDNLTDAQFGARGNIVEIEHDSLGKLPYTTAPWLADTFPGRCIAGRHAWGSITRQSTEGSWEWTLLPCSGGVRRG